AFSTSSALLDLDDGVALRRARIAATGDFTLLMPVDFKVQLGYVPHEFNLAEAYLRFPYVSYIGRPQFGFFTPPMGLDLLTSSRDITFMEPAAPLQALAPSNAGGIQIGHPVFDQRATWSLGAFGNA